MPPHGDALLQAAQAEAEQQPAGVEDEEPLPVRGMPGKQGEWIRKRGVLVYMARPMQPVFTFHTDNACITPY